MFQDIHCLEDIPVPNSLQPTVFIQNALVRLSSDECIEKFCSNIINNDNYKDPRIMAKLAQEIVTLSQIRHNRFDIIVKLCKKLFSDIDFYMNLRNRILERIFIESSYYLLLLLYRANLYDQSEILDQIYLYQRCDFAIYFAPEFGLLEITSFRPPRWVRKILKHIDVFRANDWELLKEYREIGWMPGSIYATVKSDDIEKLITFMQNYDFNLNYYIEASKFESFRIPRVTTFISFAAIFGAIKCFKLFYNLGAEITQSVMQCAIAGGCYEIIRICSREILANFDAAIEYRRHDVMDWLLQNMICNVNSTICLDWNNILAALYVSDSNEKNELIVNGLSEISKGLAISLSDIFISSSIPT
ncbi:hypothetical protein TVAG_245780 [Trichomonas vaginalis G3]|uniref:DUF3447 domain-containing protein n=1 Tax=Trichomonas vaginalis (strain ATCC PRA-98 / G3) TaxID=412133 RepID=A2E4N6_TRIV3|nr:spectrin binding [Trichomonas vaginalis G3]EAY12346.1 hypothetical protein TVAG_245780 [Trichomonas vaginalis G3]KAI5500764.1 spectrin binding [Trichomonas vaginalis G3]|eukprot:XP_001324569.1 hypothetical protein [Trichomonas vaginalis G3]